MADLYSCNLQCFFEIGYSGIVYVVGVFIADTSSQRYRALLLGLSKMPYVVKVFVGPILAQKFYETSSFRWAFGTFTIAYPVFCLPILVVLYLNQRKAAKSGIYLVQQNSSRTPLPQTILNYCIDYDGESNLPVHQFNANRLRH